MAHRDSGESTADIEQVSILSTSQDAYASRRWAGAILKVVDAPADPKTLAGWSRLVAASPSVIRAWCTLAHVRPKTSLDFARLLRLVVRSEISRAEDCLEVGDPRTIRRLFRMGGIAAIRAMRDSPTIEDFLAAQRLIQSEACLRALRAALRGAPLEQPNRRPPE